MSNLDWLFLFGTLAFIIAYGIYKNRKDKDIEGYFLGNKSLPWYHVGLSVMATQASAITFLSAPGQAFTDGMRFVQFYFGLPLAMIVVSMAMIPIFHRLKVYTAYEYLETRFDSRVRVFTAILFLIQRALATGISIYAPSIILSTIFGWDIFWTNALMGSIVLTYTVIGGTKAISYTHIQQMLIVTISMVVAGILLVKLLPEGIGFGQAVKLAGKAGKVNVIDWNFDLNEKYNVWSGILGGFFLQLSYFGTDQSQVGRYLTAKSISQSRLGILFNGFIKIPMQFGILLIGILVYVFYLFNQAPVFFNTAETEKLKKSVYAEEFLTLEEKFNQISIKRSEIAHSLHLAIEENNSLEIEKSQKALSDQDKSIKNIKAEVAGLVKKNNPEGDNGDVNYVFIRFILDYLPHGLIGLLLAVIFSASMGAVASAYSSLSATSMVDVYKKVSKNRVSKESELKISKWITVFWALFCIVVAFYASKLGSSMIELVNVLGSWFYGVILGIFLVAFYAKQIDGKSIFYAAIIAQMLIILISFTETVAYLWLNPIGCLLVFIFAYCFQYFKNEKGTHH